MPYTFAENPQGVAYFVPAVIFQAIALAAVALRIWSRRIRRINLQISDYAIFAALILALANFGLLGASVHVGLGMHIAELGLEDIQNFSKIQTALSAVWGWSLFAIKVSIIDLYVNIFQVPWFIKACYIWLAIQTAWATANFLAIVLLCRPLAYQWDKTIPGGECGNFLASYYGAHVIIFTLDIILTVLPIPVLWQLKMDMKKKIVVTLMFGLGLFINILNLIRLAWRQKVSSTDITYEYALLFFFSVLEAQLGIVLACVPLMQPVLHKLSKAWDSSRVGTIIRPPNSKRTQSSRHGHTLDSFDVETDSIKPLGREQDAEIGQANQGARVTAS
ncbi:hypothetical protein NUW58_g3198 [Xylaria curta]|uniref:Uncharacterized protein n=1 Tax=Xylaria curta TaxID=42375 RepID=A0ACC1PC13_9PEZI|nr:hypothetical protein NUW58_g3198 [Xylaria curta]